MSTKSRSDNVNTSWNSYYLQDREKRKNPLVRLMDSVFGKRPGYLSMFMRDYITPDINSHLLDVLDNNSVAKLIFKNGQLSFLELGCGQAKLSLKLASIYRKNHFTMVDFSDQLKKQIEKTICHEELNAELIIEDISSYTPEKKYEVVYGGAILCHLPKENIDAAFDKFVRHCKKKGLIISAEPIQSCELDILAETPGIPEVLIKGRPFGIHELISMHQKKGLDILYIGKACIFQRLHLLLHLNAKQIIGILPHLMIYLPNKVIELPCSYFMKRQKKKLSKILYLILEPIYKLSSLLCIKYAENYGSHIIVISQKK